MAYIKFVDSNALKKGTVTPINDNVVSLTFDKTQSADTSGFELYLDADGTVNLDEKGYYLGFTTLYKKLSGKSFELSNDGSTEGDN